MRLEERQGRRVEKGVRATGTGGGSTVEPQNVI